MNLQGKTIVLGVTGSIAAYKMAGVASTLIKKGANVHVLMTKNATNFINPITFETLTNHKCLVDTFDRNFQFDVEHVSIAKQADLVLIAPASANVIGKIANGIADDMLTTTIMACTCTKLVSPAMNTNMYNNPIVQDNIKKLENYGYVMIEPECGRLACGDVGAGKLPSEEVLVESIEKHLCPEQDMAGLNVLVTAGPTVEAIDPVRFISNHSSGKMGYAIANDAAKRGANVTLISGPVSVKALPQVKVIDVVSAKDMFEAVKDNFKTQDIVVKAAAVADYTPVIVADNKIKKSDEDMCIKVKRTEDILKYVSENRTPNQYICGFSMETENLFENSRAKLEKKKLDMIAANSLKVEGAGFGVDTNVITLITKDDMIKLPLMSKADVASEILSQILRNREAK
ncbi:MAG: bifunctional phosphopantothenoylcysteine decarboxylase/phosphopantothenate--cysteine ligase CoaBC [Lachnospiraceae bacterium]|jgi:phosphopantothenoylcysteine decarboxylase/phosphopantothenate--cysteine ligase|nr:bifunctional phosphopantothenoylcysteine decarboxylase/phosphopantothenate--cysteine ligase CoaBC [Lachnospiraceae bacterium]